MSDEEITVQIVAMTFVITFLMIVCLVWWPLPTAAVAAAAGIWAVKCL